MRLDVLVDQVIKVVAHLLPVHGGGVAEHFYGRDGIDEAVTSQRAQLTDGVPATRHDERLALAQGAHDAAASFAEFALTDLLTHDSTVALRATEAGIQQFVGGGPGSSAPGAPRQTVLTLSG